MAVKPELMTDERDMVAWRDGIFADAQMAKLLNYHPESRETQKIYKGYDPKLLEHDAYDAENQTGIE